MVLWYFGTTICLSTIKLRCYILLNKLYKGQNVEVTTIQVKKNLMTHISGNKSEFVREAIREKLLSQKEVNPEIVKFQMKKLKAERKLCELRITELNNKIGKLIILQETIC